MFPRLIIINRFPTIYLSSIDYSLLIINKYLTIHYYLIFFFSNFLFISYVIRIILTVDMAKFGSPRREDRTRVSLFPSKCGQELYTTETCKELKEQDTIGSSRS